MVNEELIKRIENIEGRLDEIMNLLSQKKSLKKDEKYKTDPSEQKAAETIYNYYKNKINKRSRLIEKAKKKISLRLKEYTTEELLKAIDNFSKDEWWMRNNAHRGIAWFFHSEERIEQFINLVPKKHRKNYQLFHNNQLCRWYDSKLKVFADWSGTWLNWNKNYPQYEKFILKDDNKKLAEGKKAYDEFIKFINETKDE